MEEGANTSLCASPWVSKSLSWKYQSHVKIAASAAVERSTVTKKLRNVLIKSHIDKKCDWLMDCIIHKGSSTTLGRY
jgi:hypothetical protein